MSDYKSECAKKKGQRKVADVSIRFISVVYEYDSEDSSNSFYLSLTLSTTTEDLIEKSRHDKKEDVTEKELKEDG